MALAIETNETTQRIMLTFEHAGQDFRVQCHVYDDGTRSVVRELVRRWNAGERGDGGPKTGYSPTMVNVRAALAELVEVKALKARMAAFEHTPECLARPYSECPLVAMEAEYDRRKPLAWAAARRALGMEP